MITCYSVSLQLSKITLTLYLQGAPGWLNSNSVALYNAFIKTRMFYQFPWFFENLVDIIKKIWPKLAKNASRKTLKSKVSQDFTALGPLLTDLRLKTTLFRKIGLYLQ